MLMELNDEKNSRKVILFSAIATTLFQNRFNVRVNMFFIIDRCTDNLAMHFADGLPSSDIDSLSFTLSNGARYVVTAVIEYKTSPNHLALWQKEHPHETYGNGNYKHKMVYSFKRYKLYILFSICVLNFFPYIAYAGI